MYLCRYVLREGKRKVQRAKQFETCKLLLTFKFMCNFNWKKGGKEEEAYFRYSRAKQIDSTRRFSKTRKDLLRVLTL